MKKILSLLAGFFRPFIIFSIPSGQQGADQTGANGLIAVMNGINNYAESLSSVASAGTSVTLIAAGQQTGSGTAGNVLAGFVMLNAGATGAVTVNLPATSLMIAALGASTPLDGSYSEAIHLVNNSGQTATLTAGDANTSILGSAAVTTGTVRKFMLRVLNSSNLSITNLGTWGF